MEAPIYTQNFFIKNVEIDFEWMKYYCKIQIIKDFIVVSLESKVKYEGYIHISKIQNQIIAFGDCNINKIFEEINLLNDDCFSLIKEKDKYKLKIKFIIFRIEKDLIIDLEENKKINLSKDDLIAHISELKEIIIKKDEKIKELEDKLKKYIKEENDNLNTNETKQRDTLNFDIKLKEYPIHELNSHTSDVLDLIMLI